MATSTRYVTDEELLQVPRDGQKYERVDGELRVNPAGFRHGAVILRLAIRLGAFVAERKLGHMADSSTGFRWAGRKGDRPDNVRVPDLSFVAAGRFPDEREPLGFQHWRPTWLSRCSRRATGMATCSRRSASTSTTARASCG